MTTDPSIDEWQKDDGKILAGYLSLNFMSIDHKMQEQHSYGLGSGARKCRF
jgi:hypothetical protein